MRHRKDSVTALVLTRSGSEKLHIYMMHFFRRPPVRFFDSTKAGLSYYLKGRESDFLSPLLHIDGGNPFQRKNHPFQSFIGQGLEPPPGFSPLPHHVLAIGPDFHLVHLLCPVRIGLFHQNSLHDRSHGLV